MSNTAERKAWLQALETTTRKIAREVVLPYYLNTTHRLKSDGSLLSEADIAAHHEFAAVLPTLLPGPVLSEEMSAEEQAVQWARGRSGLWCLDPIDGTTNFVSGIPFFGVSIAYMIDHKPAIGVVYNPVSDECFGAARGGGAWLNGEALPFRPAASELRRAVAGVDFKRISFHLGDELAVRPPYYSQRNFGSSALEWCYLAAGRLDVYLHGGQKLWDYAAGLLILEEAGGASAALDGSDILAGPALSRGVVAAASPQLFSDWHAWLKTHS